MPTLSYPATLPGPSQAVAIAPAQTRREYGRPGPQHVRVYGVDRLYSGSVTLIFNPAEVAVFRTWWSVALVDGGAWFAATWPTQRGSVQQAWLITAPPQYEHQGAGIWRVSLQLAVRGAGPMPSDGL